MDGYFGYIRVSTPRQGERGVSLQEQRDAITQYAARNGLEIAAWFEERESAAKRGRRVFGEMLKLLQARKAAGVMIHKIDRSARNLKDWAEFGELIDRGIDVKFVNESLDLNTRGGRLSADIQAVVAADYIRNLREETKKGIYGRLKQGLYPMPAPLGYLDRGAGAPKVIDTVVGPLVLKAFDLYDTGRYTLKLLASELYRLGLRNRGGGRVSVSGLSVILNNPFYTGLIRLRKTGETFQGIHVPLISVALFKRVQRILTGKTNTRSIKHAFLFRRLLNCAHCGYSLVGELQKGHVYYRCHTQRCRTTAVREEDVEDAILQALRMVEFNQREKKYLENKLEQLRASFRIEQQAEREMLRLRGARIDEHLARLTEAYLDGELERGLIQEKQKTLLFERQSIRDQLASEQVQSLPVRLSQFLELAESAHVSYEIGTPIEKRDLLEIITSNRVVAGKNVECSLSNPFDQVAKRPQNGNGGPCPVRPRTLDRLLKSLWKWFETNPGITFVPSGAHFEKDTRPWEADKGAEGAA